MSQKVEAIVASHNTRTTETTAKRLHLSIVKHELLGYNPEHRRKEGESDGPIEPTLGKIATVVELAKELQLEHVLILAADVVFKMNGEAFHRRVSMRDTTQNQKHKFTDEDIQFFTQLYAASFHPEWLTSYGVSASKKHVPRQVIVTEPIRIFGDFPGLDPKTVRKNLEQHATPGVDLVEVARKAKIKLAAQPLGSDKVQDITPKQAERIIVDRSMQSWEMVRRILAQPTSDLPEHMESFDIPVPIKIAGIANVLNWMLAQ